MNITYDEQIKNNKSRSGFSLIELLIAMAVIGILASFAYPSYQEYITRAHRSDGKTALLDLASRMERYYSERHTYQTATIGTGNATDVLANATSPEGWYVLSIPSATATTYTIRATPTGTQATNDTLCQTLTLNHLGVQDIATGPGGAPTGTVDKCW